MLPQSDQVTGMPDASRFQILYFSTRSLAGKRHKMMETMELLFEKRTPPKTVVGRWDCFPF